MRGKMIGYEGVVLPGGKIVLGRWWDAKQTPVAEVMEEVVGGSFRYERADLGTLISIPALDVLEELGFFGGAFC